MVPILSCLVIAWVVSQTVTAREIVALGIVVAIAVVGWALRRRRRI
jgi:threonine/homoserine efflux transporter RhtA